MTSTAARVWESLVAVPTPGLHCELMATFPTGVAVVTSLDLGGHPHGATVTAFASVSADPPMVLACLNRGTGTNAAVRESQAFAVNLLAASGRAQAELFASRAPDRFDRVPWRMGECTGAPVLEEDVHAVVECRVVAMTEHATHTVIVGAAASILVEADRDVLVYGMRRFSTWLREAS